jgi:D-glycero-D-manno-heptose 1,7-bisphosphate phosphatase
VRTSALPNKMIKTIFLDRDGIINEVVLRDSTVTSPRTLEEFKISNDFVELYQQLESLRLNLFVVSNQPDISRNLLAKDDLESMTAEIKRKFCFREILYCTHDNNDHCNCRKPKPGMILHLLGKYNLSSQEAILVGDSYKDILAGQNAGIRTIYLRRRYNSGTPCQPDYTIDHLLEILSLSIFNSPS